MGRNWNKRGEYSITLSCLSVLATTYMKMAALQVYKGGGVRKCFGKRGVK